MRMTGTMKDGGVLQLAYAYSLDKYTNAGAGVMVLTQDRTAAPAPAAVYGLTGDWACQHAVEVTADSVLDLAGKALTVTAQQGGAFTGSIEQTDLQTGGTALSTFYGVIVKDADGSCRGLAICSGQVNGHLSVWDVTASSGDAVVFSKTIARTDTSATAVGVERVYTRGGTAEASAVTDLTGRSYVGSYQATAYSNGLFETTCWNPTVDFTWQQGRLVRGTFVNSDAAYPFVGVLHGSGDGLYVTYSVYYGSASDTDRGSDGVLRFDGDTMAMCGNWAGSTAAERGAGVLTLTASAALSTGDLVGRWYCNGYCGYTTAADTQLFGSGSGHASARDLLALDIYTAQGGVFTGWCKGQEVVGIYSAQALYYQIKNEAGWSEQVYGRFYGDLLVTVTATVPPADSTSHSYVRVQIMSQTCCDNGYRCGLVPALAGEWAAQLAEGHQDGGAAQTLAGTALTITDTYGSCFRGTIALQDHETGAPATAVLAGAFIQSDADGGSALAVDSYGTVWQIDVDHNMLIMRAVGLLTDGTLAAATRVYTQSGTAAIVPAVDLSGQTWTGTAITIYDADGTVKTVPITFTVKFGDQQDDTVFAEMTAANERGFSDSTVYAMHVSLGSHKLALFSDAVNENGVIVFRDDGTATLFTHYCVLKEGAVKSMVVYIQLTQQSA